MTASSITTITKRGRHVSDGEPTAGQRIAEAHQEANPACTCGLCTPTGTRAKQTGWVVTGTAGTTLTSPLRLFDALATISATRGCTVTLRPVTAKAVA